MCSFHVCPDPDVYSSNYTKERCKQRRASRRVARLETLKRQCEESIQTKYQDPQQALRG